MDPCLQTDPAIRIAANLPFHGRIKIDRSLASAKLPGPDPMRYQCLAPVDLIFIGKIAVDFAGNRPDIPADDSFGNVTSHRRETCNLPFSVW